ncbi:thiamine pyrophosphate-dependent enzyme [bacterium]|nr:thiamine pyrophosphate-dependent enzyme [bacterium]
MTETKLTERLLLSGNEAIALAAKHAGVALATGYPGTPSTEILERLSKLGGPAQWAPNEKVAMEVAIGAAFGGGRAIVTMKHVGLNVAADPLFTVAYTGCSGGLVIVSADDPGMASSQNEQDNRHYAVAAGVPMLEPADSQEAYEYTLRALELSERWRTPVLLRVTTRVCHSKTLVRPSSNQPSPPAPHYEKDIKARVMIPAYARPAHHRLRARLDEIARWNETSPLNLMFEGQGPALGIICSGVATMHAMEAAPGAAILKLGVTYPLPMGLIRSFAGRFERCVVIEEGDPWLADAIRAAGISVEDKPAKYRFGELDVARVRKILSHDDSADTVAPPGKPPALCAACPHRASFEALKNLDCIVAGDIGCYTLSVLPPLEAMDTCVCMGASIGVGLGLRHVLPPDEARRVVSVIGDSTFMHSGITGLVEMMYNVPPTGHVVLLLDNGTTAMTGLQEHPGTGRSLGHEPAHKVDYEALARGIGIESVHTIDPLVEPGRLEVVLRECLAAEKPALIIVRRPCILAAGKIRQYEQARRQGASCDCATAPGSATHA